jgi:hypothetical protein
MGFDVYGRNPVLESPKPEQPENWEDLSEEEHDKWRKGYFAWQEKNPGEYFRASVWSWRPLWEIMEKTCGHLLNEEMLERLCYNDGWGPEEQATCDSMADAIVEFLQDSEWLGNSGYTISSSCRVRQNGELVCLSELDDEKLWHETRSAYGIEISHILEFCRFLRCCGGFQAW